MKWEKKENCTVHGRGVLEPLDGIAKYNFEDYAMIQTSADNELVF